MNNAIIYIHGKGGTASGSEHYKPLFPKHDVIGFDYASQTPWEAKEEFTAYFNEICGRYDTVTLIADSIGAFFAMNAEAPRFDKAYFISPVVNMEKLIRDMMSWAGTTEDVLHEKKEIETAFGETLSWEYLCYVRRHPVSWHVPTYILYGEKDNLTPFDIMKTFADAIGASVTVMQGGEHWFHTEEQMKFLDEWLLRNGR